MSRMKLRSGVFVSYSHKDKEWLERLRVHMAPFLVGEKISLWDDAQIPAGSSWHGEIEAAIAQARVAVLLVSPDFLASEFIVESELPALLARARGGLTILWVPIRSSAYTVTPLAALQAAHDPQHPLATLTRPKQDRALVEIAEKIAAAVELSAVANSLKIIDVFEPEIRAFREGRKEPPRDETTPGRAHSLESRQDETSLKLVEGNQATELINADEIEKLDSDSRKLIRAYERSMKVLFERWTELKEKRYAQDPDIRREAREQSDEVRKNLCGELNGLLSFIESLGKSLRDHYVHVRHICSGQ